MRMDRAQGTRQKQLTFYGRRATWPKFFKNGVSTRLRLAMAK